MSGTHPVIIHKALFHPEENPERLNSSVRMYVLYSKYIAPSRLTNRCASILLDVIPVHDGMIRENRSELRMHTTPIYPLLVPSGRFIEINY